MGFKHKITRTDVDFAFRKTVNITPDFLKKHGVKGLILDVDNTLTTHDHPVPAKGISEWLENMKNNGIKLIIVSNNSAERVKPFAEPLGLDFVSDSGKPLKRGYKAAMEKMGLTPSETAAVGDQLFTDVWGANFAGVKMLYVEPMELEPKSKRFIRFKRVLEKPFLPKKFADDTKEKL
ncbi:MAG: YqeG family HAD IIIA-type phosphatase [Ruminococcus sp.]|nr:YqeG family HAD IIIA-type phosphatase [Ruminococcus sp.]